MTKKNFKLDTELLNSPAEQYVSKAAEPAAKNDPEEIPEGYKINPLFVEKRTKRIQVLLQPSLYKQIAKDAAKHKESVNNVIHTILENYYKGDNNK